MEAGSEVGDYGVFLHNSGCFSEYTAPQAMAAGRYLSREKPPRPSGQGPR